jgi:membrane protein
LQQRSEQCAEQDSYMKKEEFIALIKRTSDVYRKHEMDVYSGNATFYLLISTVPFLMMIIYIINLLPWFTVEDVSDFLTNVVPDIPQVRNAIVSIIVNLNRYSGTIVVYAFAFTCLWSGSHGISALMKGLEKINHTQGNFLQTRPKAILYAVLFSLLIPSMLLFQMLRSSLEEVISNIFELLKLPEFGNRINSVLEYSGIITVAAMILVIVLTFTFLPSGKRSIKKQIPGSIFSCVTWIFFTKAFGYFITRFWRLSSVYGTLAAVFLAAMWLRFIITFLFYGASLNRAIQVKISRDCST